MHQFVQVGLSGLTQAATLTIIAVGFIVIYRGSGVFNFAHGEFMVIAPYVAYGAHHAGLPTVFALLAGLAASTVASVTMYWLILRRMIGAPIFTTAVATLGVGIIASALVAIIWSGNTDPLPGNFKNTPVSIPGGFHFTQLDIIGVLVVLTMVLVLELWLKHTRQGLRFRAVAERPLLSAQLGVPLERVHVIAWAIGGFLAGGAGLMLAAASEANPGISNLALVAFPAAMLAGMISLPATLIGAVVIAEARAIAGFYYDISAVDSVSYALLILILVVRPTGLVRSREVARV